MEEWSLFPRRIQPLNRGSGEIISPAGAGQTLYAERLSHSARGPVRRLAEEDVVLHFAAEFDEGNRRLSASADEKEEVVLLGVGLSAAHRFRPTLDMEHVKIKRKDLRNAEPDAPGFALDGRGREPGSERAHASMQVCGSLPSERVHDGQPGAVRTP